MKICTLVFIALICIVPTSAMADKDIEDYENLRVLSHSIEDILKSNGINTSVSCHLSLITPAQCFEGLKNLNYIATYPQLKDKAIKQIWIGNSALDLDFDYYSVELKYNSGATAMLALLTAQLNKTDPTILARENLKAAVDKFAEPIKASFLKIGVDTFVGCHSTITVDECFTGLLRLGRIADHPNLTAKAFRQVWISSEDKDMDLKTFAVDINYNHDPDEMLKELGKQETLADKYLVSVINERKKNEGLAQDIQTKMKKSGIETIVGCHSTITENQCRQGLLSLSSINNFSSLSGHSFHMIWISDETNDLTHRYNSVDLNYSLDAKAMLKHLNRQL